MKGKKAHVYVVLYDRKNGLRSVRTKIAGVYYNKLRAESHADKINLGKLSKLKSKDAWVMEFSIRDSIVGGVGEYNWEV